MYLSRNQGVSLTRLLGFKSPDKDYHYRIKGLNRPQHTGIVPYWCGRGPPRQSVEVSKDCHKLLEEGYKWELGYMNHGGKWVITSLEDHHFNCLWSINVAAAWCLLSVLTQGSCWGDLWRLRVAINSGACSGFE